MEDFAKLKWRQEEYTRLFENHTHFIKEENITKSIVFSPTYFEDIEDPKYFRRIKVQQIKKKVKQTNKKFNKKFKKKIKNKTMKDNVKEVSQEKTEISTKVVEKTEDFNYESYFPPIVDDLEANSKSIVTNEPTINNYNTSTNSDTLPVYRPIMTKMC